MRWNRRLGAGFVLRVAVIGLLSCGRVHPQQEGSYALFVTGILRDGCNLQSTLGMTFEGTLFLAGNIAWFPRLFERRRRSLDTWLRVECRSRAWVDRSCSTKSLRRARKKGSAAI